MLLTVAEAAMLINRSTDAVYKWIREGKLAYKYDVDGLKKVDGRELMALEPKLRRGRPTTRRESA
jgi:excisionase family DNA binding protein